MKTILSKIYLHPAFLLVTFVFILIGKFRFLSCFMITILFHELGHIFMSVLFKWNINKIIILPFGGLTKYSIKINTPIKEELLVSTSGILFQEIIYIFIKNIIKYKYFSFINYFIIIFNLIPIYPLDGSKILNCILNKATTYKKSLSLTIKTSYFFLFISGIILLIFNKLFLISIVMLILEVGKLKKEKNSLFNKFLLERYLYNLNFSREKIVNKVYDFKKDYRHILFNDNKYITEKSYLKKYFKKI